MICVLCISTSHQPYKIEDLATEGNVMSWKKYFQKPRWMLCVGCLRWALVNIWRFGRFRWIRRLWDLIGEDPTRIGKIHQRQNTHPKNHLSRKVKTHHLQNRTYFFWVPAVHLFFGRFIYTQFTNRLDHQARLRRSRVLSWTLGVFFVFFGWRLVHPQGWLTP